MMIKKYYELKSGEIQRRAFSKKELNSHMEELFKFRKSITIEEKICRSPHELALLKKANSPILKGKNL